MNTPWLGSAPPCFPPRLIGIEAFGLAQIRWLRTDAGGSIESLFLRHCVCAKRLRQVCES